VAEEPAAPEPSKGEEETLPPARSYSRARVLRVTDWNAEVKPASDEF
jgi:hypothetical protein